MSEVGHLLRLWVALLVATVLYCQLSALIAHHPPASLGVALWWNVKVWALWLLLSLALTTERGVVLARHVWNRPLLRAVALVSLPLIAWIYEWAAGAALTEVGWLDESTNSLKLLYKRLPLYATALVAIGYFGRRLRYPPDDALTVPTSRGPVSVAIREVEVIIAAENYVEICLGDGTQYLHRATLTSMARSLQSAGFVRIHRSTLVNTHHVVARLSQRRLRLRSGRVVRVGRAFDIPQT